jgi:hypothetical protein
MGIRLVLSGDDLSLLMAGARARAEEVRGML